MNRDQIAINIEKDYQEAVSRFPTHILPAFKRFLSFIDDACEVVATKTYLEGKDYEFIHALDLCEIIDYSKNHVTSLNRKIAKNTLFSKIALDQIKERKIPFTLLPGTIFEILQFIFKTISYDRRIVRDIEVFQRSDDLFDNDRKNFNLPVIGKISDALSDVSRSHRFLNTLLDDIHSFIILPNYIPANDLLLDVPLGARRYRKWFRFFKSIPDREGKETSNIADSVNLALLPAINNNKGKKIVSLLTRTPSIYKSEGELSVEITQAFDDKKIPLVHRPATIVLTRLIDEYMSLSPAKRLEEVHLLRKEIRNAMDAADVLSIQLHNEINGHFSIEKSQKLLTALWTDGFKGQPRSEIITDFYKLFLLDNDLSLQTRNFISSKNCLEYENIANEVDLDKAMASSMRIMDKVIDIGERLLYSAQYQVKPAGKTGHKNTFFVISKVDIKTHNPLSLYGFNVIDKINDQHHLEKVEIYKNLSHGSKNLIGGLSFLGNDYYNFYVRKSFPLIEAVKAVCKSFRQNNQSAVAISIDYKSGKPRIIDFKLNNSSIPIGLLEESQIRAIQFEFEEYEITIEEDKDDRDPFFSIRFHNKLDQKYLNIFKDLFTEIPCGLIGLFLEFYNLLESHINE